MLGFASNLAKRISPTTYKMNNLFKKITKLLFILITIAITGYVVWFIYDKVATSIIESKIREAGLNPDDYDLSGIAPWNVREFVTQKEVEKIEKGGFPVR